MAMTDTAKLSLEAILGLAPGKEGTYNALDLSAKFAEANKNGTRFTVEQLQQAFKWIDPNNVNVNAKGQAKAVKLADKQAIFYSGPLDHANLHLHKIAEAGVIQSGGMLAMLSNTVYWGASFMHADGFMAAVERTAKALGVKPNDLLNHSVADGKYSPGLFDFASEQMAKHAVGDVVTITPFAGRNTTFSEVEFPALLSNPKVTSIDTIPRDLLNAQLETHYKEYLETGVAPADAQKLALDRARGLTQLSCVATTLLVKVTNLHYDPVTGFDTRTGKPYNPNRITFDAKGLFAPSMVGEWPSSTHVIFQLTNDFARLSMLGPEVLASIRAAKADASAMHQGHQQS